MRLARAETVRFLHDTFAWGLEIQLPFMPTWSAWATSAFFVGRVGRRKWSNARRSLATRPRRSRTQPGGRGSCPCRCQLLASKLMVVLGI